MTQTHNHNLPNGPGAPAGLSILLVEDNPADSLMIASLMKESAPSARVQVIQDGEDAIRFLREGSAAGARPDIVLLDLNLPKKSGFEVLAEMRAEPSLRSLPVYMLTTSASPDDVNRARALGVVSFISKPAELSEMEETISRLATVEFPMLAAGPGAPGAPPETGAEGADAPRPRPVRTEVSAESFRLLVEAVRDYAIFMLDPNGYILTWNDGAKRAKQYSASEILGKHFSIFYTPEDMHSGHPEDELRIARKEGRYQEEGWRVRKDGTRFWVNVTITAIRDARGELIGFGKVTRDMTEQKQADEQLRDSEERFRVLLEGVRDYAIFMLDPTGHIVSWNRGAERIKGYKASEVLGKHFSLFYTEQSKSQRHPDFELEVARAKGVYEEEGIRCRKDGSTFWANVVLTALYDRRGTLSGFAKVTRDVTDRKKAEADIRDLNVDLERRVRERTRELEESRVKLELQKEELERSNSDLRQFAYVASHDLQEPLRMVVSYLQFLKRRSAGKLDVELTQYVDFAISGALRMRNLIRDLLSYARIEKASEPPAPVDFHEIVARALENLEHALKESDAVLTIDPLPSAAADSVQMVQVFQNLIGNAVTYRSPERRPQIRVGATEAENGWTFFVQDNGIGINPEYWQRIFVIFQRLNSDRDRYPGTGIGLSICKKIVERHHGRMWVASELGTGSTFFVFLPRVAVSAPADQDASRPE